MIETEPEFDAIERERWDALDEWRDALCPNCGNLRVLCSTPDGAHGDGYYPQRDICYVTRARLAAQRAFDEVHKGAEPVKATGWLTPRDGWTVWAATEDLTPDDDFDGAFGPTAPPGEAP